jgi:hypothetical protein
MKLFLLVAGLLALAALVRDLPDLRALKRMQDM